MTAVDDFCRDFLQALRRAHDRTVAEHNGKLGFVDERLLDLAVRRPWTFVFGVEQYPHPFQKAAAVSESIAHNSPFIDGNKRTASLAMVFLLLAYDYRLHNQIADRVALLEGVAAGSIDVEGVRTYIQQHARPLD